MDSSLSILTALIKSEICGAPLHLAPLSLDEAKGVYRLAKHQDLTHIAGNALCRGGLLADEKAKEVFEKEALRALLHSEKREAELSILFSIFRKEEIPYMPLKGSVIRSLYPAPWLRNSCDVDILIHEEHLPRARQALLAEGYRLFSTSSHDVAFDSPRGVHLELHFRLIEESVLEGMNAPLNAPWASATVTNEDPFRYAMSDALFYYYHVAHMAKHYLLGGCGVRPFLDLWLIRHRTAGDESVRRAMLESGGLLPFHDAMCVLSEVWFGDASHTPVTKEIEAHVLKGGVYGTTENRVRVQQVKKGGKLRYALSRIFLPYESLKFYYPVLEKHKWLYPLYQVRRWFRLAFFGAKHSLRELHLNQSFSAEESKKTQSHLEALGFQFK